MLSPCRPGADSAPVKGGRGLAMQEAACTGAQVELLSPHPEAMREHGLLFPFGRWKSFRSSEKLCNLPEFFQLGRAELGLFPVRVSCKCLFFPPCQAPTSCARGHLPHVPFFSRYLQLLLLPLQGHLSHFWLIGASGLPERVPAGCHGPGYGHTLPRWEVLLRYLGG